MGGNFHTRKLSDITVSFTVHTTRSYIKLGLRGLFFKGQQRLFQFCEFDNLENIRLEI